MNGIALKKVEGLKSIFYFNPESNDYQSFLELKDAWKKTNDYRIGEFAGKIFKDFVKGYLNKFEIRLKQEYPNMYLREDDRIVIFCQGTKILPGDEEYLSGYDPLLEFYATPKDLTAKSFLVRNGDKRLKILEDFLKVISEGDGIEKPILSFEKNNVEESIINVASIEQIPKVIGAMTQIYESVGKRKFKKLVKLLEERNESEGKLRKGVEKEYNKRLRDFLPADLF